MIQIKLNRHELSGHLVFRAQAQNYQRLVQKSGSYHQLQNCGCQILPHLFIRNQVLTGESGSIQ